MPLPEYFERRPRLNLDPETVAAFKQLYTDWVEGGTGAEIPYNLPAPKWQFLSYLCDTKGVLAHGSGNADIDVFEPRRSHDTDEFGNRTAVFAASDAIWAMYFAIMDRGRYVRSLLNACFRVLEDDGSESDPYYFFSINADALPHMPWRRGTIYLLPRDNFEQQPPEQSRGNTVKIQQWASLVEVKPLARLPVEPDDFPFLSRIHPHDPVEVIEKSKVDPQGFPWFDDEAPA